MKKLILMAILVFCATLAWADPSQEIGQAGDTYWDQMVAKYKADKQWTNTVSTQVIMNNFQAYKGKAMLFPKIDFSDFVVDKNGDKFYWYGEKKGYNFYVIKYDPAIQDQLRRLNSALGDLPGEYEVLGTLVDA